MGNAAGVASNAATAINAPFAAHAALASGTCFIAADVGGTNARISVVRADADGGLQVLSWRKFPCNDYPSLAAILAEFVQDHPAREGIDCMVIASAGVLLDDEVINSNLPWRISLAKLRDELHLRELHVVNDFAAAAHGVGRLANTDSRDLTPGVADSGCGPALVIGPGTGLGAAICIPRGKDVVVLPTEAGMAAFAPGNAREESLLAWQRQQQPQQHVCTEQFLSGPGLMNIYQALCAQQGKTAQLQTPAEITQAARAHDAVALDAVLAFCELLGSFIGDLAMIASANKVFIAGGIVPQILDFITRSEFRARLVNKGAMRAVLERVSVRLVENEKLGVLGAASWYLQHLREQDHREKAEQRRAAVTT